VKKELFEPRLGAVALGCALVALAFSAPVLLSGDAFGIDDWDQQLFYAESARRSLIVYHQFPFWTPYYCGGSPLLANPSSTFLNPLFVLSLAFGVVRGAKLAFFAHEWLAMLGAWMLARRLGARGLPAFLSPVVFGLSSVYTLHLATGHTIWFATAYLPFAALFSCAAVDAAADGNLRRALGEAILAGLATALLLFSGNAYFFVYQCLFTLLYGLLRAAASRPWRRALRALAGGAAVGALGFAWSAVKLIPMIAFLGVVSHYEVRDESGASPSILWLALTGRDQSLTAAQLPGMQYRWWEFGAYVGLAPLALALVGAIRTRARTWCLAVIAILFLLLAMGNGGPVWPLLRGLRGFEGLRVPSRAIVYVVLLVAVFAAVGTTFLAERACERFSTRVADGLAALALALAVANAFAVTRPPLEEAFTLAPVDLAEAPRDAPFEQSRGRLVFQTRTRYTDYLDRTPRNVGMVTCYDRLHLPVAARAPTLRDGTLDPQYRGEAWIEGASATPTATFSPNEWTLDVPAAAGGTLVVNQNADAAWRAIVRGAPATLTPHAGLLAVPLPADGAPARVVLRYAPPPWGTMLTLITALSALAFLLVARPNPLL
jgi:hypothetical protein